MPTVLAVAAHPDDIEFGMLGTLLLLRQAGWDLHVCNLSAGNLGSDSIPGPRLARIRAREARESARRVGAVWHPPVARDLEIFYTDPLIRAVAALVREVRPRVILTHSPQDYMEDHMITSRLTVTAAFARGMPNYRTRPVRRAWSGPVTVYHALPHGLCDGMGQPVPAQFFVDTTPVHAAKREALAAHASQKDWLDASQGMDSYLVALDEYSRAVGRQTGRFDHAEGWRRHHPLGFDPGAADPIREALGPARIWTAGDPADTGGRSRQARRRGASLPSGGDA